MATEDKELLIRRAVFGKQVDQFLGSEVGRYMIARAASEAEEAMEKFQSCDVGDVELVRNLQHTMQQTGKIRQWLADAVADGLQAIEIIDDRG